MRRLFLDLWPLFIGIGFLMLGNGLQGSLLGVRAANEGFAPGVIGAVTSAFFAGFLVGAVWTPGAVRRVGHIRVFAALAAIASVTILVQGLFVSPTVWGVMRFVTGVCLAGVMVVAESWLNNASANDDRGKMLSVYMMVSFAGFGGGQYLLTVASPDGLDLFAIVSMLISLAAAPMLLTAARTPTIETTAPMGLRRLMRIAPLGAAGVFAAGLINGAVFGMGPVFAASVGFDVAGVALFMGAIIAGAALMQWPIGKLSDLIDRRQVLTAATFLAAGFAALLAAATPGDELFLPLVALFGGLSLSLHTLALAQANDHLEPSDAVGASSAMVLLLGAGSVIGPWVVGALLGATGTGGYFLLLAVVHSAVGVFALWRMTVRSPPPAEEQGPYMAMPASASPVAVAVAEEAHSEILSQTGEEGAPAETPTPG